MQIRAGRNICPHQSYSRRPKNVGNFEKGDLGIVSVLFECSVDEERQVLQEAELSGQADSENDLGGTSETMYFVGLDAQEGDQLLREGTELVVC